MCSCTRSKSALFEVYLKAALDSPIKMSPWPDLVWKNNIRYDLNSPPGKLCESLWDIFRASGISDEALLAAAQAVDNTADQNVVQVDQMVSEEYLPALVEALEKQLGQRLTVPLDILTIDKQIGELVVKKPESQRYVEGMYTRPPLLQYDRYLYTLQQKTSAL